MRAMPREGGRVISGNKTITGSLGWWTGLGRWQLHIDFEPHHRVRLQEMLEWFQWGLRSGNRMM